MSYARAEASGGVVAGAVLSDCERFRYRLDRSWGRHEKSVVFVMLNPSTADERSDDPTIRKCVGFAKRWGYEGIVVVNLFAWRATDPSELVARMRDAGHTRARLIEDVYGPENDEHIVKATTGAELVVFAWGASPAARMEPPMGGRAREVSQLIERVDGSAPQCIGLTKGGDPRHPLMQPYATVRYRYYDPSIAPRDRT